MARIINPLFVINVPSKQWLSSTKPWNEYSRMSIAERSIKFRQVRGMIESGMPRTRFSVLTAIPFEISISFSHLLFLPLCEAYQISRTRPKIYEAIIEFYYFNFITVVWLSHNSSLKIQLIRSRTNYNLQKKKRTRMK